MSSHLLPEQSAQSDEAIEEARAARVTEADVPRHYFGIVLASGNTTERY